jgi:hypothetical protein
MEVSFIAAPNVAALSQTKPASAGESPENRSGQDRDKRNSIMKLRLIERLVGMGTGGGRL